MWEVLWQKYVPGAMENREVIGGATRGSFSFPLTGLRAGKEGKLWHSCDQRKPDQHCPIETECKRHVTDNFLGATLKIKRNSPGQVGQSVGALSHTPRFRV